MLIQEVTYAFLIYVFQVVSFHQVFSPLPCGFVLSHKNDSLSDVDEWVNNILTNKHIIEQVSKVKYFGHEVFNK